MFLTNDIHSHGAVPKSYLALKMIHSRLIIVLSSWYSGLAKWKFPLNLSKVDMLRFSDPQSYCQLGQKHNWFDSIPNC